MSKMPVTAKCFASHMGEWAIEPTFLRRAHAAIISGLWQNAGAPIAALQPRQPVNATKVIDPETVTWDHPRTMYVRTDEGVAIFELTGAMQKGHSKFGGVATVEKRADLRAALNDEATRSILLVIDSPGGTVAGTQSLGDEIRAINSAKPVHTHIEDMGASAAYWIGSQARRVTANRSAMVGSLGTYGVIEDSSGKAEAEGVKVHVISTGPHKGAFVDGAPVKQEQLDEYQKLIEKLNDQFVQAVALGRGIDETKARALFDGRVHVAGDALGLGLIDGIQTLDGAIIEAALAGNPPDEGDRNRRMRMARARSR